MIARKPPAGVAFAPLLGHLPLVLCSRWPALWACDAVHAGTPQQPTNPHPEFYPHHQIRAASTPCLPKTSRTTPSPPPRRCSRWPLARTRSRRFGSTRSASAASRSAAGLASGRASSSVRGPRAGWGGGAACSLMIGRSQRMAYAWASGADGTPERAVWPALPNPLACGPGPRFPRARHPHARPRAPPAPLSTRQPSATCCGRPGCAACPGFGALAPSFATCPPAAPTTSCEGVQEVDCFPAPANTTGSNPKQPTAVLRALAQGPIGHLRAGARAGPV